MSNFKSGSISSLIMNETSKKNTDSSSFKIYHIDIDNILPNERNKEISMPDIEDLANNIALVGLEQNLVVAPEKDGKYPLLTGHRRLAALKLLVSQGRDDLRNVPCVIYNPDTFQYNLSDENKDALLWVSSNIMTRKPTSQDLFCFTRTLNEVYAELRAKNPGIVLGTKKEYIAKELNISEAQVAILNSINSHLTKKALDAFLDNSLSLVVARDIARMPEQLQKEFLDQFEDYSEITANDVFSFTQRQKNKKEDTKKVVTAYSKEEIKKISDIVYELNTISDFKALSPTKANKAQRLTESICKDLDKLLQLFDRSTLKADDQD